MDAAPPTHASPWWAALCGLALAVAGGAAAAEPPPDEAPVQLDPLTVEGQRIDDIHPGDRALRDIQQGLPELGGEAAPQHGFADRLLQYHESHKDPNQLNTLQQERMLKLSGEDPLLAPVGEAEPEALKP